MQRRVWIIMGVSGCGKTTVGTALAQRLGIPFYDGDDFHPPANIAKMSVGIPLTDEDREPWLQRLHDLIAEYVARADGLVLACSALKRRYREVLQADNAGVRFVYLHSDFERLQQRMTAREGHYMKANMLHSQFATLEPPMPAEALILDAEQAVDRLVDAILGDGVPE
jgi:gluconokinase